MRTPWTRDQLEALKRLAGQGRSRRGIAASLGLSPNAVGGKLWRLTHTPPRKPARPRFDAARASALYRDGWTYLEIAARFDCAKSTVAKHLAAQSVTPRRRGRPCVPRLSALAREIVEDLKGPLQGAASVPQLIDWLGESDATLATALEQLSDYGLVRETSGVFRLSERGAARACKR